MLSQIKQEIKNVYDSCKTENEWREKSLGVFVKLHSDYTELDIDNISMWLQELYISDPFTKEPKEFEQIASEKTSYVTIHMAGDFDTAVQCAREYTYTKGACLQIAPCDYVYTGGKESGITARVICYPRFPKTDAVLLAEAQEFAFILAKKLYQKSFTIETSNDTIYFQSTNPLHGK